MSARKLVFWSLIAIVVLSFFAWLEANQAPHEICKTSEHTGYKECSSHEFAVFLAIKLGQTLDVWSAAIAAFAAAATAGFTATIWGINKRQLRHGRETERAYLSGGGGLVSLKDDAIHFRLDLQNYGKTPAHLSHYAVCFSDRTALPPIPEYLNPGFERTPFVDRIPPGGVMKSLRMFRVENAMSGNKIVYGRFWYTDVWEEDEHFFSFILSIGYREGRGFGTHADVTEAGADYNDWT